MHISKTLLSQKALSVVESSEGFSVLLPSFLIRIYSLETPHESLKFLHLALILPNYGPPQRFAHLLEMLPSIVSLASPGSCSII